ncbi:unnamed protein product [Effrenium voratum]|uniref:Tetratricopeptide repeat protein n=1 Tax=Effrenium voratum TaxID=2562239 RepID=A0AA36NLZ1_9DINO|nr:unnamed protein product [Effrenium voratum]
MPGRARKGGNAVLRRRGSGRASAQRSFRQAWSDARTPQLPGEAETERGGKPLVLVMQLATANLWDSFCQYTAAVNAQWAHRLGHRYILTGGEYLHRADLWRGGNVRAVLEVMKQAPAEVDWIFHLDCDAALVDFSKDALAAVLARHGSAELLLSRDESGFAGGSRLSNMGTGLWRRSAWTEEFLEAWWQELEGNPSRNEQEVLEHFITSNTHGCLDGRLVLLPAGLLNSESSNPVAAPAARQPVVHLAGLPGPVRTEVFRELWAEQCGQKPPGGDWGMRDRLLRSLGDHTLSLGDAPEGETWAEASAASRAARRLALMLVRGGTRREEADFFLRLAVRRVRLLEEHVARGGAGGSSSALALQHSLDNLVGPLLELGYNDEVSAPLQQCRVLFFKPDFAEVAENLSARLAEGTLTLQEEGSDIQQLSLGEGVVEASLRRFADHVAVQLRVTEQFLARWESLAQGKDLAEHEAELLCRQCAKPLLRERSGLEGPLQALHLPTDLWQACAEVVACEECTPLGQGHLRAEPGRLFVSAQTFLVARGDLSPGVATARGLLWCLCGAVVGEGDSSAGAGAGDAGAARRRPNLCGWGHVCKNAGVLLYKHRATMGGTFDPLAPYTEEAAALAHLLSLRASEGQSRFVLLPSHPCSEQPKGDEVAEALELRLLLPELILQMGDQIQKAAKVLFRPLKVSDLGASTQVVLPQESFEAVCRRLTSWTQRLPPSLSAAPQKGWKSSFLPRAPDGILENLFRAGYESRNDSLDAAVRAENLAAVLQSRPGRVEEAEALVREALSTLETAFPPEAGDVRPAGARARLAQILHLQGRTAEAEPLLRSALEAYEKSLGEDHPQALGCARNLAVLLKQQKTKLAEAEALLLRAAKGYAAAWGEEHPETQRLRRNLGNFRRWRKEVKGHP